MEDITLENIYPDISQDKKDYLIDITHKISRFVIEYYKDQFDPTISYVTGKEAYVNFSTRKNAVIGYCNKIPRVISYNEKKIRQLDHAHLIELAAHECVHLVYNGHKSDFSDALHLVLCKCIDRIEKHKKENCIL